MINVKVVNSSKTNEIPKHATVGSAGLDLRYNGDVQIVIYPGETKLIPTGLFLEIPEGYEAQVRPRSGIALKHSVTVLNSPGTIDSDYRGEVGVILINHHSKDKFIVKPGDRIAQLVFNKYERVNFEEVESIEKLSDTERGSGGYDHSGRH